MQQKSKIALIILATVIGVYLAFKWLLPLVLPFIFSYFIVVAILPIVESLKERFHIPKPVGAAITLILLCGILIIIIGSISCKLLEQIKLFIKNIPVYQKLISNMIDGSCCHFENIFGLSTGTIKTAVDNSMNETLIHIRTNIMPSMPERTIGILLNCAGLILIIVIIIMSAILIIQDIDSMKCTYKKFVFYEELHELTKKLSNVGIAYLRSQGILFIITASICIFGLLILRNKYALLIGIGIGVFDAFPVLGSGFILVPWTIIMLLSNNFFDAAVLVSMYLFCQLVRQFLEPKLLGNKIGIKPIFTIMAMYIGLQLFGIAGFILGPIALVLIIAIVKSLCPALNHNEKEEITSDQKMTNHHTN